MIRRFLGWMLAPIFEPISDEWIDRLDKDIDLNEIYPL